MTSIGFGRPTLTADDATRVLRNHWGLEGRFSDLPSERDRNFLVETGDRRAVLKISQPAEDPAILELQHVALARVAATPGGPAVQQPIPSLQGRLIESVPDRDGIPHLVRLMGWLPGAPLATLPHHPLDLLRNLGEALGRFDRALEGLSHPAGRREFKWDLSQAGWALDQLHHIADPARRAIARRHLERFRDEVLPGLTGLPHGLIHSDANDWNVLVRRDEAGQLTISGLLDLGDMVESALVNELAIGCAYAILGKPDPLAVIAEITAGYHAARPLSESELEHLFLLIGTRLAVSVVNSAREGARHPDDPYQVVSEAPAWSALEQLEAIHPRLAHYAVRSAAGLEPCPRSPTVCSWLAGQQGAFGPLLELDGYDRATVIDLSIGSPLIETPEVVEDIPRFTLAVFQAMKERGAAVGIGRWDEVRVMYLGPGYREAGHERPTPRTVHLGLDLFVPEGIPVLAPLDGVVESVRDNAGPRDYGPTVILRHQTGDGTPFWTLYGHLGREIIGALEPGQQVSRGDRIGTVGSAEVNGGWPPHPHFQIIVDLLDRDGEFPGVCRADRRAVWKSLSPDPALIVPFAGGTAPDDDQSGLLGTRRARIGPSLSVSYRRPLTIVRGWKQYLYDTEGLRYLDGVNNVPHVGHSHPAVVRAVRDQLAVLNTNTRYLHRLLTDYAARLTATLPDPLEVCWFVNSGSEANELAIRMARAATGRRGMVVVDAGYHGNTTTLIDVSPYKHDGPGGQGSPSWVRKIPMPDPYRGPFRDGDPDAGRKYGAMVDRAITELREAGEAPAAFLAESILSCGGQIVPPPGFLAEAYARARAAGGVCIADEVQIGFGRVGTHFWGFETQGVIPDIVTMGKPIGNGFPLGAVVTTRAVAEAFDTGMEFFSTFGGGPVSCAAGLAVLDVIAAEGLQAHARVVGEQLLEGLQDLVTRHPIAGDARGLGLFVGLELVRDRDTLEPADREAALVVNRMRDRGILLSTDGPFHNVIKMKPPMCFDAENAGHLVDQLDQVLSELRAEG